VSVALDTVTPSITPFGSFKSANLTSFDNFGRLRGAITMGVVVYVSFRRDLKVSANVRAAFGLLPSIVDGRGNPESPVVSAALKIISCV